MFQPTTSFRSTISYKAADEYDMYDVDATWHPALLRAARRRLVQRLRKRFAHLDDAKRHQLIVVTLATLGRPEGITAWALIIEAGGEVLWVIRNVSNTLQSPKDRQICRICLEDLCVFEAKTEGSLNIGIAECVILGATFLLGALAALAICPFLVRPELPTCLQVLPPPFVWFH